MGVKWTNELDQRRIELLQANYTYAQVAEILTQESDQDVTTSSVDGRCQKTKTTKKDLQSMPQTVSCVQTTQNARLFPTDCYTPGPDVSFPFRKKQELAQLYNALTGTNPHKILSLSDLHAPFMNFDAIEKAVLANLDADICVLNGDVYDATAFSTFTKFKAADFKYEMKQVENLLDVLCSRFKNVVWVGGNHDMMRFKKFIARNNGDATEYLIDVANPMKIIAAKYPNLTIVDHDWVQIGDVVFAHLQDFSSVDMKTVVTVDEKFRANGVDLLPNSDYNAVVIGHTHYAGKVIHNSKMLIEQGCLCHMADYKFMRIGKRRWNTAYAVIELDQAGKVDFNKSNFVLLD